MAAERRQWGNACRIGATGMHRSRPDSPRRPRLPNKGRLGGSAWTFAAKEWIRLDGRRGGQDLSCQQLPTRRSSPPCSQRCTLPFLPTLLLCCPAILTAHAASSITLNRLSAAMPLNLALCQRHPRYALLLAFVLLSTFFLLSPDGALDPRSSRNAVRVASADASLPVRVAASEARYQRIVRRRKDMIHKYGPRPQDVTMCVAYKL
ncbi:uncharacterized protein LAESUDRAFT_242875 [Laetiporus sulphureus 93-53]|uniref:Uncharacterized protein n=1 Tax=Laetiporus sulphureus 93-53 TaxID=1314785 RepID=A0A165DL47_9APHY|nr:uncharacterized protein LAESUDRAFT_242875 [Laetiporus sulphureus 93-53]KZT05122.1 hypothetical protein LAESUDRAFT_242875 [Laetiporus sulphureus 93-53]